MREKTKFKTKKLNYKARYIGPETLDITPGEIYQVIGEIIEPEGQAGYLGVIDESGDSYVYHPSLFEKVE